MISFFRFEIYNQNAARLLTQKYRSISGTNAERKHITKVHSHAQKTASPASHKGGRKFYSDYLAAKSSMITSAA